MHYKIENFCAAANRTTLCATADLVLENKVCIYGIKLIRGKNKTLFLSFPTHKSGNKYVEIIAMLDSNMKKAIEQQMIDLYHSRT